MMCLLQQCCSILHLQEVFPSDQCKSLLLHLANSRSPSLRRFVDALVFVMAQFRRQGVSSPFFSSLVPFLQSSSLAYPFTSLQHAILCSYSSPSLLPNSSLFLSSHHRAQVWYTVYASLQSVQEGSGSAAQREGESEAQRGSENSTQREGESAAQEESENSTQREAQKLLLTLLQKSPAHSFESFAIVFDLMLLAVARKDAAAFAALRQVVVRELDATPFPSPHVCCLLSASSVPLGDAAATHSFFLQQVITLSLFAHQPLDLTHSSFSTSHSALVSSLTALHHLTHPDTLASLLPICQQSSHSLLQCLAA